MNGSAQLPTFYTFLRSQRLRRQADFLAFRRSSLRFSRVGFSLTVKKNIIAADVHHPRPRLALVASRKVGNAVCRNQLRRAFREVFRHTWQSLPIQTDWLVVFNSKVKSLEIRELGENFRAALGELSRKFEEAAQKNRLFPQNP